MSNRTNGALYFQGGVIEMECAVTFKTGRGEVVACVIQKQI